MDEDPTPGPSAKVYWDEFERDVKYFQKEVAEIQEKQEVQLQNIEQVKTLMQTKDVEEMDQLMQIVRVYKDKLAKLRDRMRDIHVKARNVKEQSLKIQRIAIERQAERVEKRYYEENLIRKPPKKSTDASSEHGLSRSNKM